MNRLFLFLSMLLLLNVAQVTPCLAKVKEPIGAWNAPRHCYPNDEAYQQARRERREAEDKWVQRQRDRQREQNRRDRRTKKLLEVPREKNPLANAIVRSRGGVERYRQEVERDRERRRKKGAFELDVVSPIRNRGLYLNQLGDIIVDGKLFKDIEMGKGTVICTVCNRRISFKNIFSHYKNKKHRYFLKLSPEHQEENPDLIK